MESVVRQSYCWRTVYNFRLVTGRLCTAAEVRGLGSDALDPEVMDDLARICPGAVAVFTKKEDSAAFLAMSDLST